MFSPLLYHMRFFLKNFSLPGFYFVNYESTLDRHFVYMYALLSLYNITTLAEGNHLTLLTLDIDGPFFVFLFLFLSFIHCS